MISLKKEFSFLLVLTCVFFVKCTFGLATEEFGDRPIEISCDWYDGVAAVAKSPARVYSRWVNGGEVFCYEGNTEGFNEVLRKFSSISAPLRRLIISKETGIQESFDGKMIFFDWKLEFTGGISRSSLINRRGIEAIDVFPSITVFLGSGNIKLNEINIPAGIDVVISENVKADTELLKTVKRVERWKQAQEKWQGFIDPYLEKIRRENSEPSIDYLEVRSELISMYVPRQRIYAIESLTYKASWLFAISIDGEITDLGKGGWSQQAGDKYIGNALISTFLKEQNIIVSDANSAIALVKLVEELSSAPKTIFELKFNTNNFRIFDKRLYPRVGGDADWDYSVRKKGKTFIVKKNYIGTKRCLAYAWTFEIILDEKHRFQDVRRVIR